MIRRLFAIAVLGAAAKIAALSMFRQQRIRYAGQRRHFLVTQGGAQLRPAPDEIADAVVSVMMGGIVLDLRDTRLAQRPARLDVLCVMGGIELIVPADWKLRIDVEPLMGGVNDARSGSIDAERPVDLIVSGRVVMGGVETRDAWPR
ncbi:MAG TPA: LiaF domain-containing protein [Burkholderiaceae bacterium]|nr:LiaF domain-containing protein [Burkholderiaceae bacterium]